VNKKVLELLVGNTPSPTIINVADPITYDQNVLSAQFMGIPIFCPVGGIMLLYYLLAILPEKKRYPIRCLFWKLFRNNIYD
jgi:hypothetical protein